MTGWGQRDHAFQALYPVASKDAKAGKTDEAIFGTFSNGYKSGRDAYVYSFSAAACADNARAMLGDYATALEVREEHPEYAIDDVARDHSANSMWDMEQKRRLRQRVRATFSDEHIRLVSYRPFVRQFLYGDYMFCQRPGQTREMFPVGVNDNRAICIPGIGSTRPFSASRSGHDARPPLRGGGVPVLSPATAFSSPKVHASSPNCSTRSPSGLDSRGQRDGHRLARLPYAHYSRPHSITKDEIFDYVYAILHAPTYGHCPLRQRPSQGHAPHSH